MAAGIASKSGAEAQRDALVQHEALRREVAALNRQLAERDGQVAQLADLLAEAEAAQAKAPAAPTSASTREISPPPPTAPLGNVGREPPDPAAAAHAAEDTELSGLAIYAREPGAPEKGSRRFWMQAVERLGRHLAPDAHPAEQRRAALADPRGHAFVEARQQCRT